MRKIYFLFLSFVLVGASLWSQSSRITIFTFGNFNELLTLHSNKGSLATLATLLEKERKKTEHSLTIVNGDVLSLHFLASFDHSSSLIAILNEMSVDIASISHRDFDFGVDLLKERIQESKFPWLSSNILQLDGKPFVKEDVHIVQMGDIKVGVFSIVAPLKDHLYENSALYFASPLLIAKQKCLELKRAHVDLIIALTHQPLEEDQKLIREVQGIDLVLGGHDHQQLTWYAHKTIVHQIGTKNSSLTRIDLVIEKNKLHNQLTIYPSWRYLDHAPEENFPSILNKIENYYALCEKKLEEPIAMVEETMDSHFEQLRRGESTVGNVIADAAFSCFAADGALLSPYLFHADRSYPSGMTLTRMDVYKEVPYGHVILLEMSGSDLLESLEENLSFVEKRTGAFPQVAGISYTFDFKKPVGKRICCVKIGKEDLDMEKTYKIVSVGRLPNSHDSLRRGKRIEEEKERIFLPDAVIRFLQEKKKISPHLEGRILAAH